MENPSSYEEVIHPDDRLHVLAKLEEAAQNGRFDERFRIVTPEGEIGWVWVRGFPVRDAEGKISSISQPKINPRFLPAIDRVLITQKICL
jgi:PAS domain-containing protein